MPSGGKFACIAGGKPAGNTKEGGIAAVGGGRLLGSMLPGGTGPTAAGVLSGSGSLSVDESAEPIRCLLLGPVINVNDGFGERRGEHLCYLIWRDPRHDDTLVIDFIWT